MGAITLVCSPALPGLTDMGTLKLFAGRCIYITLLRAHQYYNDQSLAQAYLPLWHQWASARYTLLSSYNTSGARKKNYVIESTRCGLRRFMGIAPKSRYLDGRGRELTAISLISPSPFMVLTSSVV